MGNKITYITLTPSNTSSEATQTTSTVSTQESFENILELNQTALKAMTIDAMVAESATGSVHPDAVDAAAIMAFRNKLPDHIQSPIPTEDWNGGSSSSTKSVSASNNTSTVVSSSTIYNEGLLECDDELNAYFEQAAKTYDVDAKLLKCIAYAESNFNPNATSASGAMGIMQLMPAACSDYGVENAYDAEQCINGGAAIISKMLDRYDGDVSLALAAYNAGPGNVDKYNGIPPFEETQNYVNKILSIYNS